MEEQTKAITISKDIIDLTEERLLSKEFQPTPQEQLDETIRGDPELILFFYKWLENGCNSSAAYRSIRPNVTEQSARVLGTRMLQKFTKVSSVGVLAAFGMDMSDYMKLLKEGLSATSFNQKTQQQEPDFKTRRTYHQAFGKILGLE